MHALKPEFADHRVCKKCGAPAERFGRYVDLGDDSRIFKPSPIHHPRGVFTHTCIRSSGESPTGETNDANEYRYACGALRDIDTRTVDPERMFKRCYASDTPTEIPELAAEIDRMRLAAGDVG